MPNRERPSGESEKSILSVWDSEYCPSSEAFSFFREEICSIFMPWSPEFKLEQAFEGRIKGLVFKDKSIAHVNICPLVAVRTNLDVANSTIDGFYANFVLSGEVHVEQGGHSNVAKRGDLVVYGLTPVVVRTMFKVVAKIDAQGTAVLLVEQNVQHVFAVSSRAWVHRNWRDRTFRWRGRGTEQRACS